MHAWLYSYSRHSTDSDTKKKSISTVIPEPPCCVDLIGTLACRRLKKNNFGLFITRCEADPDFSLLQCCQTCGQKEAAARHANFFFDEENSKFCFDRHGHKFCETFLLKRDIWSPTKWSCHGENAPTGIQNFCKESIGNHVCLEMRQRRPYEFKMRCRSDVDFAMLQCCRTCRTNVAQLGRELFSHGASSRHCFDRHNRRFCSENAALAFRVCRRSCGFCRVSLYKEDEDMDRCKTRPEVTTEPPSILTGVMPDRTFHSYLDRIIDEINDDYNVHSSPKQHKQPLFNETFLSQL
ncbi:hypothetical protein M3Y97_00280400 [Aphelenchoides bicaudatus]|nr:hypothetical protein M3Y97_00280400 [Aphelenchoides bicaudatus]